MHPITLGKTGITSPRNGFGALPIQRVGFDEATRILRRAFESGITYYDTANNYSDSEEKIGLALADVREEITLATKTGSQKVEEFWAHLHNSLKMMRTDHIDVYQFHNPPWVPKPGDSTGMYEAMVEAKEKGLIRHIGITQHSIERANEAVDSGLYEVLQFPLSYLSVEQDLELVEKCRKKGIGFVAMKGLSGGLLRDSAAAYSYFTQFDHVIPIWGVQSLAELEEFIAHDQNPPDPAAVAAVIKADRAELVGEFCRGCGYCMPCPQGVVINMVVRSVLYMRRQPLNSPYILDLPEQMEGAKNCNGCGSCLSRCPYGLEIPRLIQQSLHDYTEYMAAHTV